MTQYYLKVFKTRLIIKWKALLSRILPQHRAFQKFVIICSARTGSTLLHTYLNSHPHIFSQGEILREYQEYQIKGVSLDLSKDVFRPQGRNIHAVGLKYFLDYIEDDRFHHHYDEILADSTIKIMILSRDLLEDQLLSLKLARASKEWSYTHRGNKSPISIDDQELNTFIATLDRQYAKVRADLCNHDVLSITYEELANHPEKTLSAVQNFLKVTPRKLYTVLRKQR